MQLSELRGKILEWDRADLFEIKNEIKDIGKAFGERANVVNIDSEIKIEDIEVFLYHNEEEVSHKRIKMMSLFLEGYESINEITHEAREVISETLIAANYAGLESGKISGEELDRRIIWLGENHEEVERIMWNVFFKMKMEHMASFFDKRADGYNDHMENTVDEFDSYYDKLTLPMGTGEEKVQILDLGCGTGIELKGLFKRHPLAHVTGVDLSREMMDTMINNNKEHEDQITTIQGSYLEVPLGEKKFDYAMSSMTMHHFLQDVKLELYKKIRKSLKDGGCYVEGDYVSEQEDADLYRTRFCEIMEFLDEDEKGLYHLDIPFTEEEQKELLVQAGFAKVEVLSRSERNAILVAWV